VAEQNTTLITTQYQTAPDAFNITIMANKRPRSAFEERLQKTESPYVFYGTPIPPLDSEVRDDGSFVPVWQQEVRDERGRKRLHGAFTGGFSAG
jgi:G patch domain-containing protein 1